MIEELKKFIIEDYISKNREIDAEFYVGIVNIYSKYKGIDGWISKIKFEIHLFSFLHLIQSIHKLNYQNVDF